MRDSAAMDSDSVVKGIQVVAGAGLVGQAYPDLLKPAAQEVGSVMGRILHAGLAPVRTMLWSIEQTEQWLKSKLEAKLHGVPPERIRFPEPTVAVPALMALSYSMQQETLREMYAKLLATAMDSATATDVHPSFVEVIKQLTPDEARILNVLKTEAASFCDVDASDYQKKGMSGSATGVTDLFERAGCRDLDRTDVALSNLRRQELADFEKSASGFAVWATTRSGGCSGTETKYPFGEHRR